MDWVMIFISLGIGLVFTYFMTWLVLWGIHQMNPWQFLKYLLKLNKNG